MPIPQRSIPIIWLLGLFLLNLALRLPTVGHFLTWDEAWILCALREFFSANQPCSLQFWKHPPIYLSLGLLLLPTKPGFEIRMQLLSLIINSGALAFFAILFAKLYGRRTALLTALIYIMLPGTMFFDTWIKRDGLVTLFCALTLLSLLRKKDILAGIFCGLSFLSKETAVFFAFGYLGFILLHRPVSEIRRSLVFFWGTAVTVSSWWYIFFYPFIDAYMAFFQGTSIEATGFLKPWWYYLYMLRIDLGWPVLLLLIAGLIAVIPSGYSRNKTSNLSFLKHFRFLPLFMLIPGYLVLSLSGGKPPWLTISFAPFLAVLAAFGCLFLFKWFSWAFKHLYSIEIYYSRLLGPIILIGLLAANTFPFKYLDHFKKISPELALITVATYELKDIVSKNVKEDEKLLILPMIYRTAPTSNDPILYKTLQQIETFYYKGNNWNFSGFEKSIKQNKIKWVLIFPFPESWQEDLYERIIDEMDPSGYKFSAGYLLNVGDNQSSTGSYKTTK